MHSEQILAVTAAILAIASRGLAFVASPLSAAPASPPGSQLWQASSQVAVAPNSVVAQPLPGSTLLNGPPKSLPQDAQSPLVAQALASKAPSGVVVGSQAPQVMPVLLNPSAMSSAGPPGQAFLSTQPSASAPSRTAADQASPAATFPPASQPTGPFQSLAGPGGSSSPANKPTVLPPAPTNTFLVSTLSKESQSKDPACKPYRCNLFYQYVHVFYFRDPKAPPHCAHQANVPSLPGPPADLKMKYPSIYAVFPSIMASDGCQTIGNTYKAITTSFAPGQLSTLELEGGVVKTKVFDASDLACPPPRLQIPEGQPYQPLIAPPPFMTQNLDPAFATCIPALSQGVDPPYPVDPVGDIGDPDDPPLRRRFARAPAATRGPT